MLRTIERTSQLLQLFTVESPEWGITELAAELNWKSSTTHDLVSSLAQIGLLKQGSNRRYTVGWRVLELSHVVLGSSTLQAEARKGMDAFASRYDETILLGVMAGGKVLFTDKIVSKHMPDQFSTADGRFNVHTTAAGKVLIAYLSADERQHIYKEHGLDAMTPKSIQSIEMLNAELERVKSLGHAYSFEEESLGLGSVAAPIFDYSGQTVAALSIITKIQQFERQLDEYRNAVVRTADQISRRLGYMSFTG